MDVFLSWSGEYSREIASVFHKWLPSVIQSVQIYFSPTTDKGLKWDSEVSAHLKKSSIGIIILTRDCLESKWIMFEAGALSHKLEKSQVCPILIGLKHSDVSPPLSSFQGTEFRKDDIFKLVDSIKEADPSSVLTQESLRLTFDALWPKLESDVNYIVKKFQGSVSQVDEPVRTDRDILNEILSAVREIGHGSARWSGINSRNFLSRQHSISGDSYIPEDVERKIRNFIKIKLNGLSDVHAFGFDEIYLKAEKDEPLVELMARGVNVRKFLERYLYNSGFINLDEEG